MFPVNWINQQSLRSLRGSVSFCQSLESSSIQKKVRLLAVALYTVHQRVAKSRARSTIDKKFWNNDAQADRQADGRMQRRRIQVPVCDGAWDLVHAALQPGATRIRDPEGVDWAKRAKSG